MEESLQKLYDALSADFDLGSFDEFKNKMQVPESRQKLYDAVSQTYDIGTFDEFESKVVIKKKDLSGEPSQNGPDASSSTQPFALTAEGTFKGIDLTKYKPSWLQPEQEEPELAMPDDISGAVEGPMFKDAQALEKLKGVQALERLRGIDKEQTAPERSKDYIEAVSERGQSPMEKQFQEYTSPFESQFGKQNPFLPEQATKAEYEAFAGAIIQENNDINVAIDALNNQMISTEGVGLKDYYDLIGKYNAAQKRIEPDIKRLESKKYEEKLARMQEILETPQGKTKQNVDAYNRLVNEYNTEAEALNNKVAEIKGESDAIAEQIAKIEQSPIMGEIKVLQNLYERNAKAYEEEIKSGRFENARRFQDYLQKLQDEADERYRNMNTAERALSNTGRIIFHSLAKIPEYAGSLTDVVEKATGLEGDTKGPVDMWQDWSINISNDLENLTKAPTSLQRGIYTPRATVPAGTEGLEGYEGLQIDFTSSGDIMGIYDKDGMQVKAMLSTEQIDAIKKLPRERKLNGASFGYQAVSTLADVGIQIGLANYIGAAKLVPSLNVSRFGGVGLSTKPLGVGFGLVAANAGMMAGDLYEEGLRATNGDKQVAAGYSLATGVGIGATNLIIGAGAEARFLNLGKLKLPKPNFGGGVKGAVAKGIYGGVTGGAGEVTEEVFLEKAVQSFSQYVVNENFGGRFDIPQLWDKNAMIDEALLSFVAGGVIGFFKALRTPNDMDTSILKDGTKDIPKTMEAIKEIAEMQGIEMTDTELETVEKKLETVKEAAEKIPEQHENDPEVLTKVVEKTENEKEIQSLKEEVKTQDEAFTEKQQARIKELEEENKRLTQEINDIINAYEEPPATESEEDLPIDTEGATPVKEVVTQEEAKEGVVYKRGKYQVVKDGDGWKVTKDGEEVSAGVKTRIMKEYRDTQVDEIAMQGEYMNLENVPPEDVSNEVLKSESPAQVAEAWRAEPEKVEGEESLRTEVAKLKFTEKVLKETGLQKSDLQEVKKRYSSPKGENDLSELAQTLTEDGRFGLVTEQDILDAITANINEGAPVSAVRRNPAKELLAERFQELTGTPIDEEFADKIIDRSAKLREEAAIEQRYDAADPGAPRRPKRIGGTMVEKAFLNRIMNDPNIPPSLKEEIKQKGLLRESLPNEYVEQYADQEIKLAIEMLGFEEGLEAIVDDAMTMMEQEIAAVNQARKQKVQRPETINNALAMMLLQKVAFVYASKGRMDDAGVLYDSIQELTRGMGQSIQTLSQDATSEGIANRVVGKALTEQAKVLKRRGNKGETLLELIEDLKDEIRATREQAKKAARQSSKAAKTTSTKKAVIRNKRQNIINRIKDNWRSGQNLGAIFDPKQQAERDAELIKDLGRLVATYAEEGITNVQEIYQNLVDTLKSIGVDDENADRLSKQALSYGQDDTPMGELPTGKQQNLMDVPLRGTVSDEQIEQLDELFGRELPKGVQVSFDQPIRPQLQSQLTEEQYAALEEKLNRILPTGEQDVIEAEINRVIDDYVDGKLEKELWAELVDIGIEEKTARKIAKDTKAAIAKAQMDKLSAAITKFKKKMQEAGFKGHEKKWSKAYENIVTAAKAGILNQDTMILAFANYFGYPAFTGEDIQKMAELGVAIFDAFSPEIKARKQKELSIFMSELEWRNTRSAAIAAKEFHALVIMGALNGLGTIFNVIQGSLLTTLPKLLILSGKSPVAARAAIKQFMGGKTNNWKIGMGALIDSWKSNFSITETYGGEDRGGKFGSKESMIEAAILRGIPRYYEKMTKGMSEGDAKKAMAGLTQMLLSTIFQPLRFAFLLKGIDAFLTHPLSEYIRFIETFNKVAKDQGMDGLGDIRKRLGDDFIKKVSKYGKFDNQTYEDARIRAEEDIEKMKSMGEKIPFGFKERRVKEIVYEQVKKSEVFSAVEFMKTGLLMGNPSGYMTGGAYRAATKLLSVGEGDDGVKAWLKTIPNVLVGLFLRVAANSANFVYNSTPFLIPQAFNLLLSQGMVHTPWGKYVGKQEAEKYPENRRTIREGWVLKTDEEVMQEMGIAMMGNVIMVMLLADMLDYDDEEDKWVLSEDRHFDVSLNLAGKFVPDQEDIDRKPMSVSFRWDTSQSFGKGSGYVMALPLLPVLAVAGGIRDDLVYRPDIFNDTYGNRGQDKGKKYISFVGDGIWDIATAVSEMSFNSPAQFSTQIMRTRHEMTQAALEGENVSEVLAEGSTKLLSRPVQTALQTNFYRDAYVTFQALQKAPVKDPKGAIDVLSKNVILMDWMIEGTKYDEYGNDILQESRLPTLLESSTLNYLKFEKNNDARFEQPEWKLRMKHPSVITGGNYRVSRKLENWKGERLTEEQREELRKQVAINNGKLVRDCYSDLDMLDTEQYEEMLRYIRRVAVSQAKFDLNITEDRPLDKRNIKDYIRSLYKK